MEFLTIHELSTQFDTTARIIRYHFHRLRRAGKLTEDQDFKRDNFVDEQHFEWKINPVSFMRASGMVLSPVEKRTPPAPTVTNLATKPATVVTQPVNQPPAKPAEPGLEREMITLLKDQVKVKDGQITDLSEQNKKLNDLNVKLVGTTVQQQNQIQDLLRLTGGKSDFSETVTKDGQPTRPVDDNPVTKDAHTVNHHAADGQPTGDNVGDQGEVGETNDTGGVTATLTQAA